MLSFGAYVLHAHSTMTLTVEVTLAIMGTTAIMTTTAKRTTARTTRPSSDGEVRDILLSQLIIFRYEKIKHTDEATFTGTGFLVLLELYTNRGFNQGRSCRGLAMTAVAATRCRYYCHAGPRHAQKLPAWNATLYYRMLCCMMPRLASPLHAAPCHAMPCHAIPASGYVR